MWKTLVQGEKNYDIQNVQRGGIYIDYDKS